MDIEYWVGIWTLALIAGMYVGLQRHRYSPYVAPGRPNYLQFKIERDRQRFDARRAENTRRWEECKAIEDAAWRRHAWDLETLQCWWTLFRNVHSIKLNAMYGYPFQFRRYRAVMLMGDREELFFPNLPERLPSPQQMWALWERALLKDASLKPQLDDRAIGIPSGI